MNTSKYPNLFITFYCRISLMAWRLLNFLKVFWISVFTPLQPVAYALDKVLFKWALFYIKIGTLFADTGLLYQIGLEQTIGLLGLDYRQHCYNCLSPALSVVFVIDDAGSVSGQLQEAFRHSVAIVNQARVSTAPFNYILSTTGNKGLFPLLCSKSVNNCQKRLYGGMWHLDFWGLFIK